MHLFYLDFFFRIQYNKHIKIFTFLAKNKISKPFWTNDGGCIYGKYTTFIQYF